MIIGPEEMAFLDFHRFPNVAIFAQPLRPTLWIRVFLFLARAVHEESPDHDHRDNKIMTPVSNSPAHLLLQRKDQDDQHSTRKTRDGAASAFSTYSFGPLDGDDGQSTKKDGAQFKGILAQHNPLQARAVPMVSLIQQV